MPVSSTYASTYHVPIMVSEVLEYLDAAPGKSYVDGTVGGGGHSEAILDATSPDGRLLGIDRDPEALDFARQRLERFGDRVEVLHGNYGDVVDITRRQGWEACDGFLVDAGVSSHQFDTPERGFSFREEGPLDMRMGPDAPTVADYLSDIEAGELARALRDYGEIRSARKVAAAILGAVERGELETTKDLAECVEDAVGIGGGSGRRTTVHPATLVFQALRIAVNRELETLQRAVAAVPDVVAAGGRAVFISFHSLEDRIVKNGLRDLANDCICPPDLPVCGCGAESRVAVLTSRPVTASDEEVEENPRARSAKLRAAEVL